MSQTLLKLACATDPKEITLPRGLVRQLLDMIEMPSDSLHEGHTEVTNYVRDQIGDNERTAHMAYLVPFLKYDGDRWNDLSPDIRTETLMLCDGFGANLNPAANIDLLYDWSHVRDSSVEALAEARRYIELAMSTEA